ncbi:phosphoribosyl-AMP cyclohydrolase [Thermanaerothrix daxensis]|uniref:Phosphoribosyl-AMP cyclohydrolase n=1 Tax=Thermanaerothrix daxensis TaxID=869279 RepID=A0A0P6XZZ0_9CHLR|nr:phosphoribosyl-AMP cyclohydrolase [Thermanaerothrix daxensis]KPL82136.1 phosphoribosyl-AMP cyclohydrolase [Thermanaerothrix daxensis]
MNSLPALNYDAQGLIPAVVQDAANGEVLMLGWMNAAALAHTLESGQVHFWSRRRRALWRKGETSGHTLEVVEVRVDCDADALLIRVRPAGPTCHTGNRTCFYRRLEDLAADPSVETGA